MSSVTMNPTHNFYIPPTVLSSLIINSLKATLQFHNISALYSVWKVNEWKCITKETPTAPWHKYTSTILMKLFLLCINFLLPSNFVRQMMTQQIKCHIVYFSDIVKVVVTGLCNPIRRDFCLFSFITTR